MTRITRSNECGNSPKNRFAEDIAVALATGDTAAVAEAVIDDVAFDVVGQCVVTGREALLEHVAAGGAVRDLRIECVVTHGKAGAVNGTLRRDSGQYGICYVIEFANTKASAVKRVRYYEIATA